MKLIKCDRCGKEIMHTSNTMYDPKEGLVSINIYTFGYGFEKREVDLCNECQKEVYNFIFNNNDNGCENEKQKEEDR